MYYHLILKKWRLLRYKSGWNHKRLCAPFLFYLTQRIYVISELCITHSSEIS